MEGRMVEPGNTMCIAFSSILPNAQGSAAGKETAKFEKRHRNMNHRGPVRCNPLLGMSLTLTMTSNLNLRYHATTEAAGECCTLCRKSQAMRDNDAGKANCVRYFMDNP